MKHFLQQPANWQPPHCPNPNCKFHSGLHGSWPYKKIGFYKSASNPRRIQRYLCQHCNRSFSRQTFSTTYWQRLPGLDGQIFMKLVGCMANRQIARELQIAPETVQRHVARLARHCLLFHWQMIRNIKIKHTLVIDGFESFEYSQYFPFHHNVAVVKETGFFLYFTDSELRRKGRMTKYQLSRRSELENRLGRPDPRSVELGVKELLMACLGDRGSAEVHSDDHPAYRRAIAQLNMPILHRVTSSRQRRDHRNPLFEVNLLELLIRHSSSNHKRETIAWSKRRQASAERLVILLVWRDYLKWRFEKGCHQTAAMLQGILNSRIGIMDVLTSRLFRTRLELPPRWSDYYDRRIETRAICHNRRHKLKYAY